MNSNYYPYINYPQYPIDNPYINYSQYPIDNPYINYPQYPIDNPYVNYPQSPIDNPYVNYPQSSVDKCIPYNQESQIPTPKIKNDKICNYCDCRKKSQLIENNDGFWCKFHYESLYGLVNLQVKIENKLCHTCGCTKKNKLKKGYDGYWCKNHYNEITRLSHIYNKNNTPFSYLDRYQRTANLMRIYGTKWCETQYIKISEGIISRSYHEAIYESDMCNSKYDPIDICEINTKSHIIDQIPKKAEQIIHNDTKIKSTKKLWQSVKKYISVDNNEKVPLMELPKTIPDTEIISIRPDIILQCNNKKLHIPYPNLLPINNNICCAYECKLHTELIKAHQGKWCIDHYKEISELRKIIKHHTGSYEEMIARLKELNLRKYTDLHHVYWAFKLFHRHSNKTNKKIEI